MVLSQIWINSANNGTYFNLPVIGKCSVRILHIQYMDKSTGAIRILRLRSDNLIFNYSPQLYLTWMAGNPTLNNPQADVVIDHSKAEYHFKDSTFNGNLLLAVEQLYSSAGDTLPASFNCLVTLDVEQIDQQYH